MEHIVIEKYLLDSAEKKAIEDVKILCQQILWDEPDNVSIEAIAFALLKDLEYLDEYVEYEEAKENG